MPVRYLMITGFTILALVFTARLDLVSGSHVDFERILPAAIQAFAPEGVRGLIVTGLLAAFMASFASSLNAAPLYVVNDVYRRYVDPDAPERTLVRMSYAVSIAVVVVSMAIGLFVASINAALQWIVSGLWGGYTASNVLKWYWWRFNGQGYFWGMITGIACSLSFPFLFAPIFPELGALLPLYLFPLVLAASAAGAIVASLATAPTDMAVLIRFYRQVRPWGWWGPVHRAAAIEQPGIAANREFARNLFNIVVGTILQTSLVALSIFLVCRNFAAVAACAAIVAAGVAVLHRTWYRHLRDWPDDPPAMPAAPEPDYL
jgi:solute:Na+ symporter, SSS family